MHRCIFFNYILLILLHHFEFKRSLYYNHMLIFFRFLSMTDNNQLISYHTAVVINNGSDYAGGQPAEVKKRLINIRIFSIRVKILL